MSERGDVEGELDTMAHVLRVVSRHGSTDRDREEQAAALAVLSEVLLEEAAARHETDGKADQWGRSARGLRSPLVPGPGAWRGFTGG